MTPIIKGAISVGGIGTVIGGGFLINSFISREKSLSSKLIDDKFTPLSTNASIAEPEGSGWKKVFDGYVKLIKIKPELKIENLSLESGDTHGINKLKKACSSVLQLKTDSPNFNNNYKLASKWCVNPISVGDLLKARKINYLDTSGDTNSTEWTNIAKRYEAEHKANKGTMISGVSWDNVSNGDYSSNAEKIKIACNSKKSKNSYEEEFEKSLEEAQKWCVMFLR